MRTNNIRNFKSLAKLNFIKTKLFDGKLHPTLSIVENNSLECHH